MQHGWARESFERVMKPIIECKELCKAIFIRDFLHTHIPVCVVAGILSDVYASILIDSFFKSNFTQKIRKLTIRNAFILFVLFVSLAYWETTLVRQARKT